MKYNQKPVSAIGLDIKECWNNGILEEILYLVVPLFHYSIIPGSLRQAAAFEPIYGFLTARNVYFGQVRSEFSQLFSIYL